jgi:ElaB/YqjD/DUF883 family membrane-anchored ribosome-binding protein
MLSSPIRSAANSILHVATSPKAAHPAGAEKLPLKNKPTKRKNMHKETKTHTHDMGQLAEDAQALMAATADVAGEKVSEARKRLAAALESAKEIAGNVRDKAVAGAKVADQTVRENPYQAIAIGVGVGVVVGYLLGRRCSRNND